MTTKDLATIKTELPALTFNDVKQFICPGATDNEAGLFLQVCKAEDLNPFKKEIYLVKYSVTDPASIVIAIDAFIKAAENNPEYDGCESGIILNQKDKLEDKLEYRPGIMLLDSEETLLVGGWARVYRKDRTHPTYTAVGIKEYQKKTKEGNLTKFWKSMPATMIAKVAKKQAFKEAFPNRYANISTDIDLDVPFEIKMPSVDTPELKQARQKFIQSWIGKPITDQPTEIVKVTPVASEVVSTPATSTAEAKGQASADMESAVKGKFPDTKAPGTVTGLAEARATVKQASFIAGRLKELDLSSEVFKKEVLMKLYGFEKIVGTITEKQAQELADRIDLLVSEKIIGIKAIAELQKLGC